MKIFFYYEEIQDPATSYVCLGWREGWKREPELAGIAASITLTRVAGKLEWPKTIEDTLVYSRSIFSMFKCNNKMPEISRKVIYPVDGWDCKLMPNGVPPNTHHDRGKNLKNIPDNLVLLRCTSNKEPKRKLDFLWDGRILESSD